MNPTTQLHKRGQSLGLDRITRDLLVWGTLQRYLRDFALSELQLREVRNRLRIRCPSQTSMRDAEISRL